MSIGSEQPRWDIAITAVTIELYKQIWDDRNTVVHGVTRTKAAKKL